MYPIVKNCKCGQSDHSLSVKLIQGSCITKNHPFFSLEGLGKGRVFLHLLKEALAIVRHISNVKGRDSNPATGCNDTKQQKNTNILFHQVTSTSVCSLVTYSTSVPTSSARMYLNTHTGKKYQNFPTWNKKPVLT